MNSLMLAFGIAILLVSNLPSSYAVKSCYQTDAAGVATQTACKNTKQETDTFIFCQVTKIFYCFAKYDN